MTQVTDESRFVEDLEADSLDVAELSIRLEEEFDITISDADCEKFTTVKSVVDYIERQMR